MASYKVVGRYKNTKKQARKRYYLTKKDFNRYSNLLIKRWISITDVEVYELQNDKWVLINKYDCECDLKCHDCYIKYHC